MLNPQEKEQAIAALRASYAALTGAISMQPFQRSIRGSAGVNMPSFPEEGTMTEWMGARRYLTQSRAGAAEVIGLGIVQTSMNR